MSDVHDMSYYGKCMVGGIFACGLTHMAVCPLDIVKCRMQVSNSAPYSCQSLEVLHVTVTTFRQLTYWFFLLGKPRHVRFHW